MKNNWRKSSQFLMPVNKPKGEEGKYDIYPVYVLEDGKIERGFEKLAKVLSQHRTVLIDGFTGVFFEDFRENLQKYFDRKRLKVHWMNTSLALKSEAETDKMIAPFLGED
ncbi:MAG: class I mannose-6-phosphate isomerase, partial [Mariniphaga sp.]